MKISMKSITANVTKRGIPAALGGAAAAAVNAAVDKYAVNDKGESYVPDWLKPFVPGIVGVAIMGGKETMSYAGAGMVGYSIGKASEDKIAGMISGEVLADEDLDDLMEGTN